MQADNKARHYYAMLASRHSNQRSLPSSKPAALHPRQRQQQNPELLPAGPLQQQPQQSLRQGSHYPPAQVSSWPPSAHQQLPCNMPSLNNGPLPATVPPAYSQQCIIRRHTQQHLVHISLGCIQGCAWISATQLTHPGPAIPTHTTATPLSLQGLGAGHQCRQAGVCRAQQAVLQGLGVIHQQQNRRTGFSPSQQQQQLQQRARGCCCRGCCV